ncbi:MAG: hypothetical protein KJ666_14335 [Bacteroidetes bacterium]|nr:hypothetical protein [Bacteroidota bacterium]MBU2585858.1 hypothetical protein [Bacteroidota bacterium]
MFKDDETIKRVRKARQNISKKFNHDPKRVVEYYIHLQEKHKKRLIGLNKSKNDSKKKVV